MISSPRALPLLGFCMLSACGGGTEATSSGTPGDAIGTTNPPTATYIEIANTTSTETTDLDFIGHDNAGAGSQGAAGTLDHDGNVISGGLFDGTIEVDRSLIQLTGGGTVTLFNMDGADHARRFSAATLGTPLFGVVGQLTAGADMPSTTDPTTTYGGAAVVTIVDDTRVYELSGQSTITADWSNGLVDVRLSGLDGTRTEGVGSVNVSNVAVIRVDDAALSGSTFSGGTPSINSADISITGTATAAESGGGFFGPGADEVGGVILIDDTGSGEVEVLGIYLAE